MPTPPPSAEDLPGPWAHREAVVNGVRLHYAEAGQGPLVVLLHGFPEFWYSWRFQIPVLADAGFRVIAPDMRGFNLSAKPRGVAAYRLPLLVEDVAGLVRHAGVERAHVIGHDWGGVVAWHLAQTRPDCLDRLAILNAPHPAAYRRELGRSSQLFRSWYVLFFQVPLLPELVCSWHRFALLRRALRQGPARTDADLALYVRALARPGGLTAALNYYRAAFRELRRGGPPGAAVEAPTLLLWGERDLYLAPGLTEGLHRWVRDIRVVRFPRAGHWLQIDEAGAVGAALINFLRESK